MTDIKKQNPGDFKKGEPSAFLGHNHTEEARKKMSEDRKGKTNNSGRTHLKKGHTPWNKGKTGVYSEERRKQISLSRLGKVSPKKGKRYKTQESKEYSLDWKEVRLSVYKRDNFICQECFKHCDKNIGIACHHIDYDKQNNDDQNLITLCTFCHNKTVYKTDEIVQYYQDKMLLKKKLQLS